jgi:hypothetical protein
MPRIPRDKCSDHSDNSSATKDYDRATNAHFRPDKPRGATGKSLIVLNPWLTLKTPVGATSTFAYDTLPATVPSPWARDAANWRSRKVRSGCARSARTASDNRDLILSCLSRQSAATRRCSRRPQARRSRSSGSTRPTLGKGRSTRSREADRSGPLGYCEARYSLSRYSPSGQKHSLAFL